MGKIRKVFVSILLVMLCFSLVGCGEKQELPPTVKTIHIGIMPDVESVPFIIAEKNGYFEQENVAVKLEYFKSAKDRDSALQSGQLDGVVTDLLAVVFANEGGYELKAIAKTDGDIKLLAGANSGINNMANLKGKSIGLSTNTIMEYTLDRMLEVNQLTAEEVKKVAIPQLPTRLEMLQGEKIEGAILPEPLAGLAVQNGARVLITTDDLGKKAGAFAFTKECLEENGAEVKAIFTAYNLAVEYLRNEPSDNYIDFLIEKQGFPAAVKETIKLPIYTEAALPDVKVVDDILAWVKAKELIQNDFKYEDLVDEKILR